MATDDLVGDTDFLRDSRGWAMKRGRSRRLLEPKRGKAALWAEIQGQGKEVLRGRSAFSRTIGHKGRSWRSFSPDWRGKYGSDWPAKRRRVKTRKAAMETAKDVISEGATLQAAMSLWPHAGKERNELHWYPTSQLELDGEDDNYSDADHTVPEEAESQFSEEDSDVWCDVESTQSTVPSMVDASPQSVRSKANADIAAAPCTRWDLAMVTAEVSAQVYQLFLAQHGRQMPDAPGWRAERHRQKAAGRGKSGDKAVSELSLRQKLLKYCNTRLCKSNDRCSSWRKESSRFSASHKPDITVGNFEKFREKFLEEHGLAFCKGLHSCFQGPIQLEPTPLWDDLKLKFLDAATGGLAGSVVPAFHGTGANNLSSIYKNGFLIPGVGNNLRVAHGSAHGLGVYAATLNNPHISWGFCTDRHTRPGSEKMLVCGVIDDAVRKAQASFMGHLLCSAESDNIRRVGDAIVAFDSRRIAPLFVASRYVDPATANVAQCKAKASRQRRRKVGPRSSFASTKSKRADRERRRIIAKVGHSVSLRPRTKERKQFQKGA